MKPVYYIWKREVSSFFSSWLAYALLFGFALMSGYFFVAGPLAAQKSDLGDYFGNLAIAVIFLAPLMSMRLLAEEKKSGTLELLLTSPLTTLDIVLGKYLGALFLVGLFIVGTLPGVLFLAFQGGFEWPVYLLQAAGFFLLGGAVLGIGLVSSALSENQMVAAVIAFAVTLGLYFLSWIAPGFSGAPRAILDELTIMSHYQSFLRGVFDLKDFLYYFLWIVLCVFLAQKVLESRQWITK